MNFTEEIQKYNLKKLIRKFLPIIIVFLVSFLWFYILTYNFNFFWEDTWVFDEYENSIKAPEAYTFKALTISFAKLITNKDILYEVRYGARPLNPFYVSLFASTFGLNVIHQRIAKAVLVGILFVFIFLFVKKIGKQEEVIFSYKRFSLNNQSILCFLLLSYILMLPELWILTLYIVDSFLITMVFEVIVMCLFFFYYNNDQIKNKLILSILFFCIAFFTHIVTLTRHIGRINFVLFFLFLLLTDKKKILTWKFGSLIVVLLLISFPVFGIISAGVGSTSKMSDSLGITEHTGTTGTMGLFYLSIIFLKTVHLSFLPHGIFLGVLLILFIVFHIYAYLNARKEKTEQVCDKDVILLRNIFIFSFIWFVLVVFVFYIARGLVFDIVSFLRCEFVIFIVPQTLFIIAYTQFVYKKYFSKKIVFQYLIYLFLILAILSNVQRLNEWRGGWGSYYLGYNTVRQYVDEHAEHAVLIIPFDHASPIYFFSTNQHKMEVEQTNISLLKEYQKNYTSVFITNRHELIFNESSVVNIANLTIIDDSPYGRIKKAMGKYYKRPMYLYEFKEE